MINGVKCCLKIKVRTHHCSLHDFAIYRVPGHSPCTMDHTWLRVSNNCMFINYSHCNYPFIVFFPLFVEAISNLGMGHI